MIVDKPIITSANTQPISSKIEEIPKMMCFQFKGKKSLTLAEIPRPVIIDSTDIIVKITALTVCGSDLHLYHGEVPTEYLKGYVLGHEAIGIVSDIGEEIKNFKKGNRVVVSAVISCGTCNFCLRGEWSCCDTTNKNLAQKEMLGDNTSAILGYSELCGGLNGCQAEYVRVPFGDINCFKIPDTIDDKKALTISDVACTGYHGCELADVKEGDNVVVFGCGPVGLMTLMWAKYRKAKAVIGIDIDENRLNFARDKFGVSVINNQNVDAVKIVRALIPEGPDKVIDCVGFRFPETYAHSLQRMVGLETDSPNIVNTALKMVRKNGRVVLIGDYLGYTNHFNIGALMEKHVTMLGGQLWPHKYQSRIFELMGKGEVDPSVIFTHEYPLSKLDEVYEKFDKHDNGMIKCLVLPDKIYMDRQKM